AGRSVSVATNTRLKTTTPGSSSRPATLMNMKDEPQIAASASSMVRWRRPTEGKTQPGPRSCPGSTPALDAGRPGTAAPPCAGVDRRGARSHPRAARAGPERLRARGVLPPLVGALRLQALCPPLAATALRGRTGVAG